MGAILLFARQECHDGRVSFGEAAARMSTQNRADEQAYRDHLFTHVQSQIAWQLDAYTSLESKAVGLLAFTAALGILAASLHAMPALLWLRVVYVAALGVSVVAILLSLMVRKVAVGPSITVFYAQTIREPTDEADLRFAAELDQAYRVNLRPLARKGLYWNISALAVGAALLVIGMGLILG